MIENFIISMNIINYVTIIILLINNGNYGNQILFIQSLSLFVLILLLLLLLTFMN